MTNPKCIEAELAKLELKRNGTLALIDVAELAHATAAEFTAIDLDVSIVRQTCSPGFVCLRANVASFKELVPLFHSLAKQGWHTDKTEPYEDYPELERRTYNLGEKVPLYDLGYPHTGHRLRVMAFVTKDGATCRKVQVGVKEEPVYELVCD